MPGKSVHSLWNIELFCLLITVESSCFMSRLFIKMALLWINPVVAFSLLSLPTTQVVFSFIRFNIFVPFHESQTLRGTVIGFKHNLPNFASAYDTHICVASNDGTCYSAMLFPKIALIKSAQPRKSRNSFRKKANSSSFTNMSLFIQTIDVSPKLERPSSWCHPRTREHRSGRSATSISASARWWIFWSIAPMMCVPIPSSTTTTSIRQGPRTGIFGTISESERGWEI